MALLKNNTIIYGTANIQSVLTVGAVTPNNSISSTTGSLIVYGGAGITGNVYANAVYAPNLQGPAFSAYPNATTSLPSSTFVKIALNSKEFDTNSNFDSTTNYRFTPTVAGYYQITGNVSIGGSSGNNWIGSIYKNGSEFKRGNQLGSNAAGSVSVVVSALVYFNGSTDYVELYGYQNTGSTQLAYSGASTTFFQGAMVRSS